MITGSPIYYSEPTGGMRSLLERLTFPAMSYNDYSSVFKGRVDVDIFLTMNAPMQYYKQAYEGRMQEYFAPMRFLNGQVRIFPVCDTLQVKDYSKYDMAGSLRSIRRQSMMQNFRLCWIRRSRLVQAYRRNSICQK